VIVVLLLSFVLQAVVDVVASSGWLHPALAAMEMCQMVVQGQWEKDSPLLQLPHITPQLAAAAAAKDISTVFDLIEMDEEERRELLQVSTGLKIIVAIQFLVAGHSSGGWLSQYIREQWVETGGAVLRQGPCGLYLYSFLLLGTISVVGSVSASVSAGWGQEGLCCNRVLAACIGTVTCCWARFRWLAQSVHQ
jgi:hypothetical protein